MVLYKWQADKFQGTGVVSQIHSCDMQGGIGKVLRSDPAGKAPGYFRKCLAEGLAHIPSDRHGHSPIYLAATAGMRLVQSEDPEAAEQILGNVTRVLERSGLLFSDSSVRIISGKDEAVAGWISANYLLRTIYPKPTMLLGMLDMGGASTQITFVREHNSNSGSSSIYDTSLQLYGARHELYARSYMCFGQEQLQNRYKVLLLKDLDGPNTTISLKSPCHNEGYVETLKYDDFINACTQTEYTPKFKNVTVTFEGSSEPEDCKDNIRLLLSPAHCEEIFQTKECFSPPPSHPANTSFVAVSGLYYVMKYLNFDEKKPPIEEFLSAADERCSLLWEDLVQNDSDFNPKYAAPVCFNSQYQSLLLTEGYGVDSNSWKNIDFLKKVNGTSVGWTMGFTIRHTNAFPEEHAVEAFPTVTFTIMMFVLALLIGICVTLLIILLVKSVLNQNTNHIHPKMDA